MSYEEQIMSPVGEIVFMALNRKVKKNQSPDSPEGYTVRLKFDTSNPEHAEWKKTVSKINRNIVVTGREGYTGTEFDMKAFSLYKPEIGDKDGNTLEEVPNFYKGSTGTARMVVQPYTGNELGGSINLTAVIINNIETNEEEGATGAERESVLTRLKAELQKNAKKA